MFGGISGDKRCEKRKLYTRTDYLRLLNESMNNDETDVFDDSTGEDQQMLAMVDQWLQTDCFSSEDESDEPTGHEGDTAEQTGRDNLTVQFSHFNEISDSPKSTTDSISENSGSPTDRNSENSDRNSKNATGSSDRDFEDSMPNRITESAGRPERNSENVGGPDGNSRNTSGRDRNSEDAESSDSNSERSEGVDLGRLHEIISSQSRPRNTLGRIAQLRRNVLRNNEDVTMLPGD